MLLFDEQTDRDIAERLLVWADARDHCNGKPGRTGKRLDSRLLRVAAHRLAKESCNWKDCVDPTTLDSHYCADHLEIYEEMKHDCIYFGGR